MKRLLASLLFLSLASIACQAVNRVGAKLTLGPTPTPTYPAPISCSDDSCLDACLDRVDAVLKTQSFADLTDYAGKEAEFNLVLYQVADGQLGEPLPISVPEDYQKYQEDYAAQQRIWNYAAALIPESYRGWITDFTIYTDGPYNSMAWIGPNDYDLQKWTLGADIVDSENPMYLTDTLVHEIGHLITLNSDQMTPVEYYYPWKQDPDVCAQFLYPEACSNPDSYINQFYQRFWTGIYDEWLEKVGSVDEEEYQKSLDQFYSDHSDQFIRDYAATDISEDMAESFAGFILGTKPEGESVIQQKILFYYEFPELVEVRSQMIQAMCSYQP